MRLAVSDCSITLSKDSRKDEKVTEMVTEVLSEVQYEGQPTMRIGAQTKSFELEENTIRVVELIPEGFAAVCRPAGQRKVTMFGLVAADSMILYGKFASCLRVIPLEKKQPKIIEMGKLTAKQLRLATEVLDWRVLFGLTANPEYPTMSFDALAYVYNKTAEQFGTDGDGEAFVKRYMTQLPGDKFQVTQLAQNKLKERLENEEWQEDKGVMNALNVTVKHFYRAFPRTISSDLIGDCPGWNGNQLMAERFIAAALRACYRHSTAWAGRHEDEDRVTSPVFYELDARAKADKPGHKTRRKEKVPTRKECEVWLNEEAKAFYDHDGSSVQLAELWLKDEWEPAWLAEHNRQPIAKENRPMVAVAPSPRIDPPPPGLPRINPRCGIKPPPECRLHWSKAEPIVLQEMESEEVAQVA